MVSGKLQDITLNNMKKLQYLSIAILCIGALFKNWHAPGANFLISAGLIGIALYYIILAFSNKQ